MFGTLYFGETYFGGVSVQTEQGNCDGMFGTATFGSPYFGQHIDCVPAPPVPPVPPTPPKPRPTVPVEVMGGIGHRKHKSWTLEEIAAHEARRQAIIQDLINEEIDEEDIMLTVGLYLNIR